MTPAQLRAARALLNWSRAVLAEKSGTSAEAVQWFESRGGDPKLSTTLKWRKALQKAGVVLIDADAEGGPGVRLREPKG
jgi:transcriptional regulator with XRE-family HTH domain